MGRYASRIYQDRAVDATWGVFGGGAESALVVLPTGMGKTTVAAMAAERIHQETAARTLFLAHRETLIDQAYRTFTAFGLDASVEMAGQDARNADAMYGRSQVVVGSIQTMQKQRLARWATDEFGLIVIDECHHSLAGSYSKILSHFQGYRLLGITATPDRGDQRNLGGVFNALAYQHSLGQAIHGDGLDDPGGWLVKPIIRKCMISVDLKGIRTSGGDFNVGDLEERIGPKLEELADGIRKEIGTRQTVVFVPDVGSAQALADVLNALEKNNPIGASAAYVSGSGSAYGMSRDEKKDTLDRFNRNEFRILVNCELLFEGWDCPQVKAVVIARPTLLRYRYAQMVGRGLRLFGDYSDCLVIDFDWEADSATRDLLALVVDLFDDGTVPEDVMEIAREIERDSQGTREDPEEIIDEAEEIVRVRRRLQIRLTGKTAQYRSIELDPVGVGKMLDIKITKRHDIDIRGDNPASDAQKRYLKALGMQAPEGISKWGAGKMITQLQKRRDQGMATVDQVQALLNRNVAPEVARSLSSDAAGAALVEIARAAAIAPKSQKEFFQ